ncbi:MAG: glutaredoxin 3 [Thiohalophilus sp.]|uniref:glutaredoxin 3 n=1 Tax=Thiohalophilus sp. TaxID=3028392 RepID=UPI0028705FD1|nr:glutaredoxin 3 [Thiohalophilus sp.]MDR9436053.1 glutaredoxin 3 [Thiohalophilus sp.]
MNRVQMYCTKACPYCQRAEQLLRKRGIRFEKIRVDLSKGKLREMLKRSRRDTVPQIFINDRHIGGYDELTRLDKRGQLMTFVEKKTKP